MVTFAQEYSLFETGVPDLARFGYFRILGLESVTVVVRTDLDLGQNSGSNFLFFLSKQ